MLANLLESANPRECAKHSFEHFHAIGLTYVNLLRTPALTAKLYITEPGTLKMNTEGYVVNPHSHCYRFHTYVVSGWVRNIEFAAGRGEAQHKFEYSSPLSGGNGFTRLGTEPLGWGSYGHFTKEEAYFLDEHDIHTLTLPEDEQTVLFLLQYHDVCNKTVLYSRSPEPPSTEGLYEPMKPMAVANHIEQVRETLVQ